MERLKQLKETLLSTVQGQMGNLSAVNAEELGAAIDMIKDLDEALYYCSVVKAMEDSKKEQELMQKINPMMMEDRRYYSRPYGRYYDPRYDDYRQRDREYGRMYYNGGGRSGGGNGGRSGGNNSGGNSGGNNGGSQDYMPQDYRYQMRDRREGRSPEYRKYYMEGKENHHTKESQMQELDKYMAELAMDITEMIQDATQEEKVMLQQKLNTLATKIK